MLAELRTITWVTGKPPIIPEAIFPTPCAINSRFLGVTRFSGSILSVASTHSKVSKLATKAMVKATIQTLILDIALKLGKMIKSKSATFVGTLTIWLEAIPHTASPLVETA